MIVEGAPRSIWKCPFALDEAVVLADRCASATADAETRVLIALRKAAERVQFASFILFAAA